MNGGVIVGVRDDQDEDGAQYTEYGRLIGEDGLPVPSTEEERTATCKDCGVRYSMLEQLDSAHGSWGYDSHRGVAEWCLACWLGVGPNDECPAGGIDDEAPGTPPVSIPAVPPKPAPATASGRRLLDAILGRKRVD